MSSFLPDVIVAQAVDKLHLKSPIDRATLNDMVNAALSGSTASSTTMAAGAGGPTIQSRVFMTAYVVSGLGQAKDAGYNLRVDDDRLGTRPARGCNPTLPRIPT
jgi:alpha-2-macroglobulin